jgi:hypothetical protein
MHTEGAMTRLAEAGVVTLEWTEDEDGNVFAAGLQDYEIDPANELAIFQGDKCVKVYECEDLCHAVAMVYSNEGVCRWNIKNGKDGHGYPINERGWRVPK